MAETVTVLEALLAFNRWFGGASWDAWRALLAALYALPMTEAQRACYQRHTGREAPPSAPAREGWIVAGRRAGKSLIAAFLAVYAACFRDYAGLLGPGERGVVMVVAADRKQGKVILRYVKGLLDCVPALAQLVERVTAEAIHFRTGISIEVHAPSYRGVRGYTVVCFIGDELAFWRDETSANPDVEVINALKPAMATVPGAVMLCISSPYARRGALWAAYRDHFGKADDPILVWQADTRSMNPTVPESFIAEAYAEDAQRASAEYGAEFRRDIEGYVSQEALAAVVRPGRYELPPVPGVAYVAAVDPSGGAVDSMTLAIAHLEGETRVLDCLREVKPPFSPESVVELFAAECWRYGVTTVHGDRYAGEWAREPFKKHRMTYEVLESPKSDLYRDCLPLLNSGRVELLDVPRLLAQLGGLERRTARGGKDSIDHGPGAHDDLANVGAAALVLAGAAQPEELKTW